MYNVNGWISVAPLSVSLEDGDNIIQSANYVRLVPTADDCRIVGFSPPPVEEADCGWIMEIANSSTERTVLLVAGSPAQLPAQMITEQSPGIALPPSSSQRLYYSFGIGWVPLLPGAIAS